MKTTAIISETGSQHGYGSMPYKWVSGLTRDERAAVRAGQLVVVTDSHPCHEVPAPFRTMRRVLWTAGRYVPRMIRAEEDQSAVRTAMASTR